MHCTGSDEKHKPRHSAHDMCAECSLRCGRAQYQIDMSGFRVWIDQDICTGDGLCEEICPSVFGMHDDGLAYVKEAGWDDIWNGNRKNDNNPVLAGATGVAMLREEDLADAIESAEECPGECIFIEAVPA